jgi:hypothetical protein
MFVLGLQFGLEVVLRQAGAMVNFGDRDRIKAQVIVGIKWS